MNLSLIGASAVLLPFKFIAGLPLRFVHLLGAGAGWITYLLSRRYRGQMRADPHAAAPVHAESAG